jgi:hypothetical protein
MEGGWKHGAADRKPSMGEANRGGPGASGGDRETLQKSAWRRAAAWRVAAARRLEISFSGGGGDRTPPNPSTAGGSAVGLRSMMMASLSSQEEESVDRY